MSELDLICEAVRAKDFRVRIESDHGDNNEWYVELR